MLELTRFPGSLPRRPLMRWALACAAMLCLGAGSAPHTALAQAESGALPLERRVKAAFLYKFLGYAEFPASSFAGPVAPITIGVTGADDIAAELARIVAGRTVGNRPIAVRTLREGEVEGGGALQLLFIGGRDCPRAARLAQAAGALLVVTDCDSAQPAGSVINFRIVDDRVRFDVSLDAAERNNVKLSSRLLTVANHVQKGAQQ
jgi:hypothetical protein